MQHRATFGKRYERHKLSPAKKYLSAPAAANLTYFWAKAPKNHFAGLIPGVQHTDQKQSWYQK
jgi:hypothetical protein